MKFSRQEYWSVQPLPCKLAFLDSSSVPFIQNPKYISKNYQDDDYFIDAALKPEKYKERQERRPRREYKKDNEEKEGEEKVEEGETKEEKKEERKERYKPRPIEIKEEDKLHRNE